MLAVDNIHVYYGAIHALKGVSISVEEGSIVTLIGANGAGKSTTMRLILGLDRPSGGAATEGQSYADLAQPPCVVGALFEAGGSAPGAVCLQPPAVSGTDRGLSD